jgi:hypothetical protein
VVLTSEEGVRWLAETLDRDGECEAVRAAVNDGGKDLEYFRI